MTALETITLPAPQLPAARPVEDKWRCEFEAFQRLRPELLTTHIGKYVLIHNGQVFASGTDDLAMALDFFVRHGNVPIHIGLVTSEPDPVVRIPHYRTIKTGETS